MRCWDECNDGAKVESIAGAIVAALVGMQALQSIGRANVAAFVGGASAPAFVGGASAPAFVTT